MCPLVNFFKVLELDQYAFLTAYGLLNTKHVKLNGKSQICFVEIVKSQRHFMVILTHYIHAWLYFSEGWHFCI